MLEASEKFLVSDESGLAAELSASVQQVIVDEATGTVASPICVKRRISRTTAPHGLTTAEVKRAFNATHCMTKQRRQVWFATLGDGLQDMDAGEARNLAAAFLKALVSEQKKHGLPQYWLQVWECSGGLHTHVIFIGNRSIIERLRNSALSGQFLHVRWAYDAYGLPIYLSKERTPQTQFGIGAFIRGARKRGSHQLPGGGDRVRLSAAPRRWRQGTLVGSSKARRYSGRICRAVAADERQAQGNAGTSQALHITAAEGSRARWSSSPIPGDGKTACASSRLSRRPHDARSGHRSRILASTPWPVSASARPAHRPVSTSLRERRARP